MDRLPQFPPSITIIVNSTTPNTEVLELAIDEALESNKFQSFKLEPVFLTTMDFGLTMITYDVIKTNIDVHNLVYRRYL